LPAKPHRLSTTEACGHAVCSADVNLQLAMLNMTITESLQSDELLPAAANLAVEPASDDGKAAQVAVETPTLLFSGTLQPLRLWESKEA